MLLPDDLIMSKNCSKDMIKFHRKYNGSVMASMNVNKKTVSRWGIFKLRKKIDKNNFIIDAVIEKPSKKNKQVLTGKIDSGQITHIDNKNVSTGDLVQVHIIDSTPFYLKAELI